VPAGAGQCAPAGRSPERASAHESDAVTQSPPSPAAPSSTLGRLRSRRTFESLQEPTFRIYWIGTLAQTAAMNMENVARALLVFHLTSSGTLLGVTAVASALPFLLLSLGGGVLADRVSKRDVMIVGQVAAALTAIAIAVPLTLGLLSWQHVIGIAALKGVINALMMPSRQAIVPELVGREGIMNAMALNQAGQNMNRLIAPAIAGFLIQFTGYDVVFYVIAVLYVLGSLITLRLPRGGGAATTGGGVLGDIQEGVAYARRNTTVLLLLTVTLLAVIFAFPYLFLLPILVSDAWGVDSGAYGMLVTASGLGAIVSSLFVASWGNRGRGMPYLASMALLGVALTAVSFSPWFELALLLMVVVGLGQGALMALSITLLQYYTAEEYRGRVMSIWMMEFGIMSVGALGIGLLADAIGGQLALGGAAAVVVLVAAGAATLTPRLRRLD
jgi:MFS family permease